MIFNTDQCINQIRWIPLQILVKAIYCIHTFDRFKNSSQGILFTGCNGHVLVDFDNYDDDKKKIHPGNDDIYGDDIHEYVDD